MILPILENIKDYMLANDGGLFRCGFHHVTLERRQNAEGELQTFPVAWEDGKQDGRPMFEDYNYFYLRLAGPAVATASESVYDSCKQTLTNTYPVRFVAHIREDAGGEYGERRANVFQQILGHHSYIPAAGAVIQKVTTKATGYNADKYEVFEAETDGVEITQLGTRDNIVLVDLDIEVKYTPSECVEDDLFCNLDTLTQVSPCVDPAADVITLSYSAGETDQYVKPAEAAMYYDTVTSLDNVSSLDIYDEDGNAVTLPASVARGKWLRVVIAQSDAGAISSVVLTRTMEDGSATYTDNTLEAVVWTGLPPFNTTQVSGEFARWNNSGRNATRSYDYDARYPFTIIGTGTGVLSLDDGETVEQTLTPPFTLSFTKLAQGEYYLGFSENPYALPGSNVKNSIAYGFYYNNINGRLQVVESGTVKFQDFSFYAFPTTALLQIENTGTAVNYYRMSTLIYTSLIVPGGGDCTGVFSPVSLGTYVNNLIIS